MRAREAVSRFLNRTSRFVQPVAFKRASAVRLLALASIAGLAMAADGEPRFPDVIEAQVRAAGGGRYDFDVTISSPYDTPARYADGFRVTDRQGRVFGERKLWHDHANEQPFTRDLYGVVIPAPVRSVRIEARDKLHGYGDANARGRAIEVRLPDR